MARFQSLDELQRGALDLLQDNRKQGIVPRTGQHYDYSCPSRERYPYQWLWDSCFHAIVLAELAPDLARAELATLLQMVQPDGFLPHVIFWEGRRGHHVWPLLLGQPGARRRYSAQIQPPMVAVALERYVVATGDDTFLARWLPTVTRYYRWLRQARDWDGDGLLTIVQPFESGLDASPQYDEALGLARFSASGHLYRSFRSTAHFSSLHWDSARIARSGGFNVEDLLVNAVYAFNLHALARLVQWCGDAPDEWRRMAAETEHAILERCFDALSGRFVSLVGAAETPARALTVASLMPLLLTALPAEQAAGLVALIEAPEHFGRRYPLPSVAASEATYLPGDSIFLWRGPTWLSTNWLVYQGLRLHGFHQLASRLAERGAALVLKSGFREYYDPDTGAGHGAEQFGWSTLVVDLLRSERHAAGSVEPLSRPTGPGPRA